MGDPLANNGVGDEVYLDIAPVPSSQYVGEPNVQGCSMSNGTSTAFITFNVLQEDMLDFTADVLGYSQAAGSGILRTPPSKHPIFPFLFASRIEWTPRAPDRPTIGSEEGGQSAQFKLWQARVQFESPPYRIAPSGGGPEYERYTIIKAESHAEFIQRMQGIFIYPTVAFGIYRAGANKVTGPNGVPVLLCKTKIQIKWMQVPDDGLFAGGFNNGSGSPDNILNGLGTVNSIEFLGYDPQTILFESFVTEPVSMACGPSFLGMADDDAPRCWNVTLNFIYFDPPAADLPTGPNSDSGALVHGHNLLPCPGNNKWYRVYRDGGSDVSGDWKFAETDLNNVFLMNE